jgi:hypothetical protein
MAGQPEHLSKELWAGYITLSVKVPEGIALDTNELDLIVHRVGGISSRVVLFLPR